MNKVLRLLNAEDMATCISELSLDDKGEYISYCISSILTTEDKKRIDIEFEYCGADYSTMKVYVYDDMHIAIVYIFHFDTDIFKKHLNIYFQQHIEHFANFDGTNEIIYFYNEVLEAPTTIHKYTSNE